MAATVVGETRRSKALLLRSWLRGYAEICRVRPRLLQRRQS